MASSSSSPTPFPSKPALKIHNFELPGPKWNKPPPKPTNRRSSSSSADKSPTPAIESNSKIQRLKITPPKNNTVSEKKPDLHPKKDDTNTAVEKKTVASSKFVLKLPPKNSITKTEAMINEKSEKEQTLMDLKIEINKGKGKAVVMDEGNVADDKVWNLRPRRTALRKCGTRNNNNADVTNAGKSNIIINNNNVNQVVAVAGQNEGRGGGGDGDEEETVVTKLNVALKKQEIADDMYAFTGQKNTKRPRKRHRSVQKKLDHLFPGLGLINVTPEAYNVSESKRKG